MGCCWHGHGPRCHGYWYGHGYGPPWWESDQPVRDRRRVGRDERLRDLEERQAELQEELAEIAASIQRMRQPD